MADAYTEHPFTTVLLDRFAGQIYQVLDESDDRNAAQPKKIGYRILVDDNFSRDNFQDYLQVPAKTLGRMPTAVKNLTSIVVPYEALKPEYQPIPPAATPAPEAPRGRWGLGRLFGGKNLHND